DIEKMCNLGEGIYEQGVKDGEKKGEKRGKRRGIKIGERRGERRGKAVGDRQRMLTDAKGMYAEGLSVDAIARVQKVSVDAVHQMIGLQPG
ncbi:MAG: hypothetical protein Q4A32_09695, partial [Lachnospiraceae bacterium]|nr:hypothetical protein [Lachnospiraceae bacterium]